MISRLRDGLSKIDIFGQTITLTFREEEQYKTSFGGFMSVCIIATIISFFYSNIIKFFAMEVVTSTTDFTFSDDPNVLILDPEHFMFAVQIEQDDFVTNPFFNITVQQRHYYRYPNGTQYYYPNQYIDLVQCTLDHFQPIFSKYNVSFQDQFEQQGLSNFLCPNLNHTHSKNMTVGGVWSSTDYYFLKFSVTNCINQTDSSQNPFSWQPICKSDQDIQDTMDSQGSFRVQVFTTNFMINPNRPDNYVQPYLAIDQFYTFVPDTMFVQSDVFFRTKTVVTDEGILMYPVEKEEYFANRDYGDQREQFEINRLTPNYYAALYFQRSPYSYSISRSYQTLDQLLSYLGGFTQFMIVVVGVVVRFYNRQHQIISMANDLYEFDLDSRPKTGTMIGLKSLLMQSEQGREMLKSQREKGQNSTSVPKIQVMNPFTSKPDMLQSKVTLVSKEPIQSPKQFLPRLSQMKIQTSQYFEKFKEFVKKKKFIGLGFRLVISSLIPLESLQNDESIVITKAINQVNKELDIEYIIRQTHEVQKLKSVLFNQEQQILFNFSHKPIIALIKDKKQRRSTKIVTEVQDPLINFQDNALLKQFTDLVNSYQKIMGMDAELMTDEQLRFNQRLITLLGGQLPHILEKEIAQYNEIQSGEFPDDLSNDKVPLDNQENK